MQIQNVIICLLLQFLIYHRMLSNKRQRWHNGCLPFSDISRHKCYSFFLCILWITKTEWYLCQLVSLNGRHQCSLVSIISSCLIFDRQEWIEAYSVWEWKWNVLIVYMYCIYNESLFVNVKQRWSNHWVTLWVVSIQWYNFL